MYVAALAHGRRRSAKWGPRTRCEYRTSMNLRGAAVGRCTQHGARWRCRVRHECACSLQTVSSVCVQSADCALQ
eukprot:5014847-Prymnesium_polylepis.1